MKEANFDVQFWLFKFPLTEQKKIRKMKHSHSSLILTAFLSKHAAPGMLLIAVSKIHTRVNLRLH